MGTTTSTQEQRARGARVPRVLGGLLVWAGGTVLLYLVWMLWFTGLETQRAQEQLLDEFDGFDTSGSAAAALAEDDPVVADEGDGPAGVTEIGSGVAIIEFERPGSADAPVTDRPYVVVEGTTLEALTAGPGHYVTSALPGEQGNFAVAGHRTTNGAPFYDLDQLRPGDLVHATDRDGVRHTYEVMEGSSGGGAPGQHIVPPSAMWVLGPDPLDTGGAVLTLTTCHPRWSAAERLIVFADLVDSSAA